MLVIPGHLAKAYLKNLIDENLQVQPAGVDLTVKKIFKIVGEGLIGLSERQLPQYEELHPINGVWHLSKGVYKVVINEVIMVPNDTIAMCFPRSSLLRMGVDVRCALWDPGYYGRSEILLIVHSKGVVIKRNARIAQLIFIKLSEKPAKVYEGKYKGENL